ncbi:MAG: LptF/LptG family permease [Gemmatimonadales bacterium]
MILGTLDRYVLKSWIRIFVITALGFPLVSIIINLTDFLDKWLARGLTAKEIAISYFYSIPENAFLVMPAAVLFATVFTIGNLGRHSELTAAKAGGLSFYRLVAPLVVAAIGASLLAVVVGELAPGSSKRMNEIQNPDQRQSVATKFNFVYRAEGGWVYTIGLLDLKSRRLRHLVLERQGDQVRYPDLSIMADSASYDSTARAWRLWSGTSRSIQDPAIRSFQFDSMILRAMTESPSALLAEPKKPEEMRYAELGRYIEALRRSGNDANKLVVEQALKLALPATCLVIMIFAAPLAVTTPRTGSAVGIAFALATTVVFLMMAQISKAVGAGGVVNPNLAAWFPNALFFAAGLVLLARVRT